MIELLLTEYQQNPWAVYMFWGLTVFYIVLMTPLIIGFLLNPARPPRLLTTEELPTVTVLVCARNEERDLPGCLATVRALDYPAGKLQIILVNDSSTDRTPELIRAAADEDSRILALDTADMPPTKLIAKARGISWAMQHATGEWVFFTDADSRVQPTWLRNMLSYARPDTGMLGGGVAVESDTVVSKVELASWSFLQMFSLGMSGFGVPVASVGPNMAIRRSIYEEAGGLESVDFSLGDDLALHKMTLEAGAGIVSVVNPESLVMVRPVTSFEHLISQQRRWFRGGIDNEKKYLVVLFVLFGYAVVFGLFMLLGWLASVSFFLLFHAVIFLVDLSYFVVQKYRFRLRKHLRYAVLAHFYKIVIFTLLASSFLFTRRARWIGVGYADVFD